jgi:hypothetical protein
MIPACGPPSSLSPLITTAVAPSRTASPAVGSPASPYASSGRRSPLPKSCRSGTPTSSPRRASSRGATSATKPESVKLLRCTFTKAPVVRARRGAVVVEVGAVGGAHLGEPRAALGHDVGHAEAAADLDELAARDHRVAARRRGC